MKYVKDFHVCQIIRTPRKILFCCIFTMNYYHDKSLENGELEQERSYEIKVLRIKGRKIDIEVQYVFQ